MMKTFRIATSALLATAAYAAPATLESRQQRPKEAINASYYPTLQRYTRFAVASLATFTFGQGSCPNPPFKSKLVVKINNVLTDTQVAVFQDDAAKELIVSFPGTCSLQDFVTDFAFFLVPFETAPSCLGCQVHGGVYAGYKSIRADLIAALADLRSRNPGYQTVVTGHSLGGGFASITYTDLKSNNIPVSTAYTMGSLRVGNQAYADYTDKLSGASDSNVGTLIRITSGIDGIPHLPIDSMGFVHTRTEINEIDNAAGQQSPQTTFRCYGQEASDCNKSTAQGVFNRGHLVYTNIQMTNGNECHNTS